MTTAPCCECCYHWGRGYCRARAEKTEADDLCSRLEAFALRSGACFDVIPDREARVAIATESQAGAHHRTNRHHQMTPADIDQLLDDPNLTASERESLSQLLTATLQAIAEQTADRRAHYANEPHDTDRH